MAFTFYPASAINGVYRLSRSHLYYCTVWIFHCSGSEKKSTVSFSYACCSWQCSLPIIFVAVISLLDSDFVAWQAIMNIKWWPYSSNVCWWNYILKKRTVKVGNQFAIDLCTSLIRVCIQKFPDCPPWARTTNGTAFCHYMQLYRYLVSQSSEFCRHKPLCCFSTRVYCCKCIFRYRLSSETSGCTVVYCNFEKYLIRGRNIGVIITNSFELKQELSVCKLPLGMNIKWGCLRTKWLGERLEMRASDRRMGKIALWGPS
jgi:hypothetical protein